MAEYCGDDKADRAAREVGVETIGRRKSSRGTDGGRRMREGGRSTHGTNVRAHNRAVHRCTLKMKFHQPITYPLVMPNTIETCMKNMDVEEGSEGIRST